MTARKGRRRAWSARLFSCRVSSLPAWPVARSCCAQGRPGWALLGVRRARLGGSVVFVGGACEDGENNPARDEAPTALGAPVWPGCECQVRRHGSGHTFPKSGLPDCQSGRPAGLHNGYYQPVSGVLRPPLLKFGELLIVPIMYPSHGLEPALLATFPESGLSRRSTRPNMPRVLNLYVRILRQRKTLKGWGEYLIGK